MPYISEVLGKLVVDCDGKKVGKIDEMIAIHKEKMPHPQVIAIEVKIQKKPFYIPLTDVGVLATNIIPLNKKWEDVKSYKVHKHDIFLVRDVLDKQIIDVNGVRVVRVNDVELARVNGNIYLANVDISTAGLMRRLGLPYLGGMFRKRRKSNPVSSWAASPGTQWSCSKMINPCALKFQVKKWRICTQQIWRNCSAT